MLNAGVRGIREATEVSGPDEDFGNEFADGLPEDAGPIRASNVRGISVSVVVRVAGTIALCTSRLLQRWKNERASSRSHAFCKRRKLHSFGLSSAQLDFAGMAQAVICSAQYPIAADSGICNESKRCQIRRWVGRMNTGPHFFVSS